MQQLQLAPQPQPAPAQQQPAPAQPPQPDEFPREDFLIARVKDDSRVWGRFGTSEEVHKCLICDHNSYPKSFQSQILKMLQQNVEVKMPVVVIGKVEDRFLINLVQSYDHLSTPLQDEIRWENYCYVVGAAGKVGAEVGAIYEIFCSLSEDDFYMGDKPDVLGKVAPETITMCEIAFRFVKRNLRDHEPRFAQKLGYETPTFEFIHQEITKSGPSGGVMLALVLISAVFDVPLKKFVVATGELATDGNTHRIGSVFEKGVFARATGINFIFPKENKVEAEETFGENLTKNMIFIDDMYDALEHILPGLRDK